MELVDFVSLLTVFCFSTLKLWLRKTGEGWDKLGPSKFTTGYSYIDT
jgi:hypothetical protein